MKKLPQRTEEIDLYKELVYGIGYAVCPVEDMTVLNKIRSSFIDKMDVPTKSKKDIDILRKAMVKMSRSEINKVMINLLSFTDLSDMMINACQGLVKTLCGKELFIQRRAHTIINVPGKKHSRQWTHYEMISGISPFTYVLWAPLHDIDDDGGAYFIDQKTSSRIMKKGEKMGLVNGPDVYNMMAIQKPPRIKFGEVIVFNPFVLHGNIPFSSKLARIACNVRFQSYNKPLLQKNSDYLKYYRLD